MDTKVFPYLGHCDIAGMNMGVQIISEGKEIVMCVCMEYIIYNRILFSFLKGDLAICNNIGEPIRHYC